MSAMPHPYVVTPGLDPGVHRFAVEVRREVMDCRVKPGNDI
jgi:hypothetical protein